MKHLQTVTCIRDRTRGPCTCLPSQGAEVPSRRRSGLDGSATSALLLAVGCWLPPPPLLLPANRSLLATQCGDYSIFGRGLALALPPRATQAAVCVLFTSCSKSHFKFNFISPIKKPASHFELHFVTYRIVNPHASTIHLSVPPTAAASQ